MSLNKYDSFQPKRATNIDGFFAKPVDNRPRQPVFRSQSANPQHTPGTLGDMPLRSVPQNVLASSSQLSTAQPVLGNVPVGMPVERPRDRSRGRDSQLPPVEDTKKRGRKAKKEKKDKKKRSLGKRIAMWSGIVALVLVILGGGFLYKNLSKITGNKNPFSLLNAFTPAHLDNQDGRVNILVAGNSADDIGHNGGELTDSIMVLSVDTNKNTALMLSIPRDLWVSVPGDGHAKINSIYPNGGMDLLQETIEENLALTINYQALVNYKAFQDLVQSMGGIKITIKSVDPRGIYDPSLDYTSRTCCALAKYPNGPATLNGKQALNLARARGDAYGSYGFPMADFDRTQHQRDMLLAIKDKASSASVIANPFKVAGLVEAIGNNVKTNLELNEIQTLYTYMKKIDNNKIDSYNINTLKSKDTTMLANYTSPNGQSALIPAAGVDDFTDIQAQITKILTADAVTKEAATVIVLNGTDTSGLAGKQIVTLEGKGMEVATGDAPAKQVASTLVDNSGGTMPNSLAYLKKKYSATATTNASLVAAYPNADFILILGDNTPGVTKPTTIN